MVGPREARIGLAACLVVMGSALWLGWAGSSGSTVEPCRCSLVVVGSICMAAGEVLGPEVVQFADVVVLEPEVPVDLLKNCRWGMQLVCRLGLTSADIWRKSCWSGHARAWGR